MACQTPFLTVSLDVQCVHSLVNTKDKRRFYHKLQDSRRRLWPEGGAEPPYDHRHYCPHRIRAQIEALFPLWRVLWCSDQERKDTGNPHGEDFWGELDRKAPSLPMEVRKSEWLQGTFPQGQRAAFSEQIWCLFMDREAQDPEDEVHWEKMWPCISFRPSS